MNGSIVFNEHISLLTILIVSTDGLNAFHSFLQSEFSDENIEFWMSCEDFKKTKDPVKMAVKAKKIYEYFIQAEGPREVRTSFFFLFNKISFLSNSGKSVTCNWPHEVGANILLIIQITCESETGSPI